MKKLGTVLSLVLALACGPRAQNAEAKTAQNYLACASLGAASAPQLNKDVMVAIAIRCGLQEIPDGIRIAIAVYEDEQAKRKGQTAPNAP